MAEPKTPPGPPPEGYAIDLHTDGHWVWGPRAVASDPPCPAEECFALYDAENPARVIVCSGCGVMGCNICWAPATDAEGNVQCATCFQVTGAVQFRPPVPPEFVSLGDPEAVAAVAASLEPDFQTDPAIRGAVMTAAKAVEEDTAHAVKTGQWPGGCRNEHCTTDYDPADPPRYRECVECGMAGCDVCTANRVCLPCRAASAPASVATGTFPVAEFKLGQWVEDAETPRLAYELEGGVRVGLVFSAKPTFEQLYELASEILQLARQQRGDSREGPGGGLPLPASSDKE